MVRRAEHIRANQSPLRRYVSHLRDAADPSIVQPQHLLPARTSEVCGQCHGVWNYYQRDDERRVNARRFSVPAWRRAAKNAVRRCSLPSIAIRRRPTRSSSRDPGLVRDSFWSDGMIRVSGREYNGLIDSPCFNKASDRSRSHVRRVTRCTRPTTIRGRRQVWADTHQVSTGLEGNEGCLQCHEKLRSNLSAHTKHGSDFDREQLLQLPHALHDIWAADAHSGAIKSARRPFARASKPARPNACNLCHLDKTLSWTAQNLSDWYQTPKVPLNHDEETVAASLLWLLKGDAGQRALSAWSMGWKPAQEASRPRDGRRRF